MAGSRLDLAARLLAFALGCRSHDFPQYPPNYREYVYVTNGGSDTVTVLDVVNVRVDRELPVGHNPVGCRREPHAQRDLCGEPKAQLARTARFR